MSELAPGGPPDDPAWRPPRGPHDLPRDPVAADQRRQLLAGVARALAKSGYAELTVEDVVREADISRTAFYENFESKRESVRAAHEATFDRLAGELFRACAEETDWPAKVAAGVRATVAFATANPAEARLLVVDPVAADPPLVERVLASHDFLVGLLRNGREQSLEAELLPELTERALIGAASSVIGSRLLSDQAARLPLLEGELVQLMLMPYVGMVEARRMADVG